MSKYGCDVVNKEKSNESLLNAQIKGIKKEIEFLSRFYNEIVDYRFQQIKNTFEWDIEESISTVDKLEIYKAMYLAIVDYLSEESHRAQEELILKHYPECKNIPDDLVFQLPEQLEEDPEDYPFD